MRYEKKIAHYKKQIEGMQETINRLSVDNAVLRDENQIIKTANASLTENLDQTITEFEKAKNEYFLAAKASKEAKENYDSATNSLRELQKKYRKEMDKYLKGVKKRV